MNHLRSSARPSASGPLAPSHTARLAAATEIGRAAGQPVRRLHRLGDEPVVRKDAVDEPDLKRLLGRQQLRLEDQLERPRRPDRAREPLRPAGPRHHAERHLRQPDRACVVGDVAEVAREGELAADAQRLAVDRRDHGLVQPLDHAEERVERLEVEDPAELRPAQPSTRSGHPGDAGHRAIGRSCEPRRHLHRRLLGVGEHLGDVVVRDEQVVRLAGEDDRADRAVLCERPHEPGQLRDHRPVHEVARRVLDPDDQHAPIALELERHCRRLVVDHGNIRMRSRRSGPRAARARSA